MAIALIDLDSILYQSVYKCVSISQIREILHQGSKDNIRHLYLDFILNESINRVENKILNMMTYLNDIHINEVDTIELYITTCSKNFRNDISKDYKKSRKKNKYVWMLRNYYINNEAFFSDTLEADDLIADRCKELDVNDYVVVSIDKDLRTIGGYYWSPFQQKIKDSDNNPITEYKNKTVEYITSEKADGFLWQQMLMGDKSDDIIGLKGIGVKKSNDIILKANNNFITVAREYIKRGRKQDFYKNYKLLKLGK